MGVMVVDGLDRDEMNVRLGDCVGDSSNQSGDAARGEERTHWSLTHPPSHPTHTQGQKEEKSEAHCPSMVASA